MSPLDKLVRQVMAFDSYEDLEKALDGGYVPTLRHGRKAKKLAHLLERLGWRVWRGSRCTRAAFSAEAQP